MTTFLSGRVKKTPSIQADPQRYEFLDLKNAEPDLGIAAGNNYVLTSDTVGNRVWVDQLDIITNNVDQAYVNALNIDADLLDGQNGIYYLDWTNTLNKPDPTVTIDLSGDITGTGNTTLTDLASGIINIVTELSNTGVVANTYGSASKVPQITVDEDGRITAVTELNVAGVSSFEYDSPNGVLTIGTADGSSFSANLDLQAFDTDGLLEGSTNQYFTIARANTAIDERVTKSFVDALNINADTLDGQDGAYYVNFNNFVNLPDPKIDVILSGDVSGIANTTLTNLGNGLIEITTTVADDSHNHTIDNVDGLQEVIDSKLDADANTILAELITVDGAGSNLDADLLDGQHGTYYLNFNNFTNLPDPVINASLSGDVTGTGTVTVTDLLSGNLSIVTTVENDSHNHTVSTITDFSTGVSGIITSNVNKTFIDALNVDADTLDSQDGSYYLNFNNFTNLPDPNVEVVLTGDVSGTANTTLTNLGNGSISITATVADNSHNHTIENITGLQDALDSSGVTANTVLSLLLTVDGSGSGLDADLLDGQESSYYLDWTNTTNKPDPNIEVTLTGDVTGSANATLTDLGNGSISITATVADDSHNHVISNIDGLQTALDGKLDADANTILAELLTVDGSGSGLDADLLDGQDGSYYLDWTNTTNKPDPNIEVTLTGDVTGSANATLTDLSNGSLSITATVADDSHNHIIANVDGLQTALDGKVDETVTITAGTGLTGGGNLSTSRTISHADTSSQANTNNTNGNVVQNVQIDTFGHVTSLTSVDLDTRYDTRYVNTSGDTLTGFLTLHADPTNALHAATKEYVDTIAAASLHYHNPVRVESPIDLNVAYNNGTSGVGATLTNAGTQAALVIDGVTLDLDDRVLIYEQANTAHNGVYTVTDTGSISTNWELTRADDADSYNPSDPASLGQGDAFYVQEGDTGAGELYVMTAEGTITFGTTGITFSQISSSQIYSAGSGLELNGTVFSHTDTSSQANTGPLTGANVVSTVDLDTFGHVVGLSTRELTLNDFGFTGDPTADSYINWNLLVDSTLRDTITSGENVNFVGGSNINLTYSAANNTITFDGATTLASDATITLSAGTGLTGGGNFTTDQSVNETITFSHADTSTQASINNSGGTVIQDITLDTYGHITALGSKTLTTTDISEGTNQYYNITRANSAIDARVTQSFINALNVDADTLDSQNGTYYLDWTNTTNKPDPNIDVQLSGDVTGSANTTLTDLGNGVISITTTVANDSHNHTVSTITDFPQGIDNHLGATYVDNSVLIYSDAVGGFDWVTTVASANNSTNLNGQAASYYLDWTNTTNKPDPNIEVTLTGDVTGSANTTLTDLANGSINISTTLIGGIGSNIDADKLDGQHGSYYLDYNNFANIPTIGNATITISAGGGLTTGGNFTTNQTGNETITINHADTSSQANTNNTTGTVIQNVQVDTYGHVTSLSSTALTTTVIGEGTNQYYTVARANSAIDSRVTKSYVDALNVDADTLDGIDSSSFLRSNATDSASGTLTFTGTVNLDGIVEVDSTYVLGADSATTSSTSTALIAGFATVTYSSGKFIIQASNAVSGEVHVTELLVVHNGVTASAVEYGTVFTGAGVLATYEVDISAGTVRILATPASSNSTTFKVTETLITG